MSESSATTEILVRLPKQLLTELEAFAEKEELSCSDCIYRATKSYVRDRRRKQTQDAMRRGYMEMAKINLSMASEALQAEYEADHTIERLVSGG
ncbi:CopG family ribbon-helix-helix protein [Jeotgalibacillus salarius]|uniref:Antitoxin endoai n=1 Tax=Jeotgalibacillus salarius TaxID=546023 RepID=A0A4Y8LGL1_9BACL|nr:antitoxin endoai [Jeotgalibacillus salarius]TFE01976.1 antitoxin endoai [Jeotgalibacillus salarius]